MAEYIEREAAIDALQNHYEVRNAVQNGIMDECVMLMMRVPAADVVPVQHGRWRGHDIGNGTLSIDEDTCSLCGSRFYQIAETGCDWNFCPNCGAKMDKDGDGA